MGSSDASLEVGVAKLIYRAVATCGALGGGFPRESLQKALAGGIDAVISQAGSINASPRCPDSGAQRYEADAVRSDFRKMVEAAESSGAVVILGGRGMGSGNRHFDWILALAREVFEELAVRNTKVAIIRSERDPAIVPDEASLRESQMAGQMGVHPLLTALHGGARYVFADDACGATLFAADMLRRGIAPGLAYHVGHVLEHGALACVPGSPSDCLVAEIYNDGHAVFIAPNESRFCTPHSLAAHSLYEQAHPQLQFYPEGVLALTRTEFFAVGTRGAGIRRSRFYRTEYTIRNRMFPVHYYSANGREWSMTGEARTEYFDVGEPAGAQNLDDRTLCAIEDVPPQATSAGSHRLLDLARVVRSKTAGIGWMTLDVLFVSKEAYEAALRSNLFCARNVADELGLGLTAIVGTYFVDNCNAIKITLQRPVISTSPSEQDVFGIQQQSMLEQLLIPMSAES